MEPAVKIVSNEKIRTFNEKVRHGLEHAINFMMGDTPITIGNFEPFLMPIETYISAYKKRAIMIQIHSENDFKSKLYWFFELKTAVHLGCILRMLPQMKTDEKLNSLTFDELDQDSFGEVGNQLCGILDRAFRGITNRNIHLRMDFEKKVYPDESIKVEQFENSEEFVVLLCDISIKNGPPQKLTLLLPRSFYEGILFTELELQGIVPNIIAVHSFDENNLNSIAKNLTSRYVKVKTTNDPDHLMTLLTNTSIKAIGIHLKGFTTPLSIQNTILLKRILSNRIIQRTPYFLCWDEMTQENVSEASHLGLKVFVSKSFATQFSQWCGNLLKIK